MRYVLFLLLALSILACGSQKETVMIGEITPSFALPDLDGGTFSSEDIQAKPTIINFWATWCGPCKREIPTLRELYASGRVDVIGIALDEGGAPPVKRFVKREGIEYKILIGNPEVFNRFNGLQIPHTVVLDSERKVVSVHVGQASREDFEADLAAL